MIHGNWQPSTDPKLQRLFLYLEAEEVDVEVEVVDDEVVDAVLAYALSSSASSCHFVREMTMARPMARIQSAAYIGEVRQAHTYR